MAVSLDGVVDAAGAKINRRHHLPAPSVVGLSGKVALNAGNRGGEIELLRAVLEARRKGLRRQSRGAVGPVDRQGEERNRRERDGGRRPPAAQRRLAENIAGAARRRGPEKTARRLRPGRFRLRLGEQPAAVVPVDFGQLLAIELRLRIAAGAGGRCPRQGP